MRATPSVARLWGGSYQSDPIAVDLGVPDDGAGRAKSLRDALLAFEQYPGRDEGTSRAHRLHEVSGKL